jgi:acetyltransferase-like isoleucine patch superfamily enzyme
MFRKLISLLKLLADIPHKIFFTKVSVLSIIKNSMIDKTAAIGPNVKFYNSKIGRYSNVGWNTIITDTVIGSFCSIAGDCVIGGASHPIDWVSTSPVFYNGKNAFEKNFSDNEFDAVLTTYIGNDVWIGGNSLIKQGVKISDGAVIGFGSVVTKDVGPYEIWAGNPAKIIRKRFDEETIGRLLTTEWWNWNEEKIIQRASSFNSLIAFFEEENYENSTHR